MDKYRVEILKLDHKGRGIAKINNKIIFIPFALPKEVVDIEIVEDKKNYMVGQLIEIIKPNRVKPICPYFGICGGCDIMNMPYNLQLEYKMDKVKNILGKTIDISIIENIVPSIDIYNYRNKVSFKYNGKVGFYKKDSNEVVNIDKCYIANTHINRLIDTINFLNIKKEVVVKSGINDMIIVDNKPINNNYITIDFGKLKYYVSPNSFFQVNTKLAIKMYEKIKELSNLSNKEIVLDLYCGTGSIGLYLAKESKEVIGIEIIEDAIKDANKNKELNNIKNARFYTGDVGKVLNNLKIKPDITIIDPPRSGLNKQAIEQVIKLKSNKVIYVSCDLMSLNRDLNILKDYYNITKVIPFDMFPNTYHVECVCVLNKR